MVKVGNVELTDDEVREFREVFDLVDKDKGGTVSVDEVRELMGLLGMHPTLESIVAEIDIDGNGEVDFEEFLQVMAGQRSTSYTKRDLLRSFRLSADPGLPQGFISPQAMENALVSYCTDKATVEEAIRLVHQLEPNSDGLINYQEKVNLFVS